MAASWQRTRTGGRAHRHTRQRRRRIDGRYCWLQGQEGANEGQVDRWGEPQSLARWPAQRAPAADVRPRLGFLAGARVSGGPGAPRAVTYGGFHLRRSADRCSRRGWQAPLLPAANHALEAVHCRGLQSHKRSEVVGSGWVWGRAEPSGPVKAPLPRHYSTAGASQLPKSACLLRPSFGFCWVNESTQSNAHIN